MREWKYIYTMHQHSCLCCILAHLLFPHFVLGAILWCETESYCVFSLLYTNINYKHRRCVFIPTITSQWRAWLLLKMTRTKRGWMNEWESGNINGEAALVVDTACFVLKFEAWSVATKYWTYFMIWGKGHTLRFCWGEWGEYDVVRLERWGARRMKW